MLATIADNFGKKQDLLQNYRIKKSVDVQSNAAIEKNNYFLPFFDYFSDRLTIGKNRQKTAAPTTQDIPSITIVEGAPIK